MRFDGVLDVLNVTVQRKAQPSIGIPEPGLLLFRPATVSGLRSNSGREIFYVRS